MIVVVVLPVDQVQDRIVPFGLLIIAWRQINDIF